MGVEDSPAPEAFERLTKAAMMTELKRLGIGRGLSRKRKAELVAFYRDWHASQSKPSASPASPLSEPVLSTITLPPEEAAEVEEAARRYVSAPPEPSITSITLPPDEAAEVEEAAREYVSVSPQPPRAESSVPPGDERRANPRVRLDVEIGYRSESNFYVGFSTDISEGGIFVSTVNLLPVGRAVTIEFGLPNGAEIEAEGAVAWVRQPRGFDSDLKPGMGIAFTAIDETAIAAIKQYMSRREPLFYVD